MGQDTMTTEQVRNCVFVRNLGPGSGLFEKKREDGQTSLIIEGKPIFRSGNFEDSNGFAHEWETLHMQQMCDHYTLLKDREIFADIPVRKGHVDWGGIFSDPVRNAMDELIGYMTNFRTEDRKNPTDGQTYTYLLADLEILEETAIKNIKSGLWRNVSAEISGYRTNAGAEYWPVMMGVAYVDMPAVEGLKSQHSKAKNNFSLILEDDMNTQNGNTDQQQAAPPAPPAAPAAPAVPQNFQQPAAPATPFQFKIAGKDTSDYAAVQAHIATLESRNETLETAQREQFQASKAAFVKSLVDTNKLAAPSLDDTLDYAKDLDETQFAAWKKMMDGLPVIGITGQQGAGFSQSHEQVQQGDQTQDKIDSLKGIISMHQSGGMSRDAIIETATYKELIQLDKTYTLPTF
ncbi:capsid maturation protease [Gordonia phage Hollow]|nr:capsid maturation protease [Gordonia phage Hollow]